MLLSAATSVKAAMAQFPALIVASPPVVSGTDPHGSNPFTNVTFVTPCRPVLPVIRVTLSRPPPTGRCSVPTLASSWLCETLLAPPSTLTIPVPLRETVPEPPTAPPASCNADTVESDTAFSAGGLAAAFHAAVLCSVTVPVSWFADESVIAPGVLNHRLRRPPFAPSANTALAAEIAAAAVLVVWMRSVCDASGPAEPRIWSWSVSRLLPNRHCCEAARATSSP